MNVLERMLKISPNYQEEVVYNAILNLEGIDIEEFILGYKGLRPSSWRNDIAYALGHFDKEKRIEWSKYTSEIGISLDLNRSQRELYTQFTYTDDEGNDLPAYVNMEKGRHQSK